MYRGEYESAKNNKRNRIKSIILIASLILLFAAVVGGTVAYLRVASDRVTNTFTPAEITIIPSETKSDTSKADIKFSNPKDGTTVPVYVRATLVIYWTDTFDLTADGVNNPTEQTIAEPAGAKIEGGNTLGEDWLKVGDIYYYTKPVAPGSSTTEMLDEIKVAVPDGSTARCYIDVRAEAIQAEPTSVVEAAWKDIDVDENGNLKNAEGGQK